MLTMYPAVFFKESEGYSVIFPDLDGLATCGESADEAMAMAIDCLAGYVHWLKMDGESIPSPSPIGNVDMTTVAMETYGENSPEGSFVNMVAVDVDAYARDHFDKSVRKTLTIPAWLNNAALNAGINFSQTLQDALLAKVQTH